MKNVPRKVVQKLSHRCKNFASQISSSCSDCFTREPHAHYGVECGHEDYGLLT